MRRLKVAMICHVSNKEIRENLLLNNFSLKHEIKKILGMVNGEYYQDYSIWNTLTIKEFESISDIEMHVIIPHPGMKKKRQDFELRGVFYHCFNQDMGAIWNRYWMMRRDILDRYHHNTKMILSIIDDIKPDVINMIGAEGPFFNSAALKIDTQKYPIVLTLQTAVSDPDFPRYYPISKKSYQEVCKCEQALFQHCQYIATDCAWYRTIASRYNKDAIFVRFHFCSPSLDVKSTVNKEYDFAYWASNIEKAGDDVIEAFAIAHAKDETLTLNIIGKYTGIYREHLEKRINELGLGSSITLSGYFPTHQDALKQALKSRFALLPVKIDIVSGTIREAFALGLPVVSYITRGTPCLNRECETILLSDIEDYGGLAANMLRLKTDKSLAEELIKNGKKLACVFTDNSTGIRELASTYYAIYEHFHLRKEIPSRLMRTIY